MSPADTFGARLRAQRIQDGLTLRQLGERSRVPYAAISKIERDKINPTLKTALRIARGLDVDLALLVFNLPPEEGDPS